MNSRRSHSITSSARASSIRGIVRPSAFAAIKLIDEIEFGGLLDRDVSRLRPAQNLVDKFGGAPEKVRQICPIGHQTSRFDVLPKAVHCRQSRALRQDVDSHAVGGR